MAEKSRVLIGFSKQFIIKRKELDAFITLIKRVNNLKKKGYVLSIVFISLMGMLFMGSLVSATESVTIPPVSIAYIDKYLYEEDTLIISVDSNDTINVYIMDFDQLDVTIDLGLTLWEYKVRWKDITYLDEEFKAVVSDRYYIVFYNKGLLNDRYVEYDLTIIRATEDIIPSYSLILIALISVISIGYLIKKNFKKI